MNRVFSRTNILVVAVAIVASPVIWWVTAGVRGQLVARYDIARGHYKILQYGLPLAQFGEYRTLMLRRYGVDVQAKGCVITEVSGPYSRAYNRVVVTAVKRKFGHDVFAECWNDATRQLSEHLKPNFEGSARASEEAHPASSRQ